MLTFFGQGLCQNRFTIYSYNNYEFKVLSSFTGLYTVKQVKHVTLVMQVFTLALKMKA